MEEGRTYGDVKTGKEGGDAGEEGQFGQGEGRKRREVKDMVASFLSASGADGWPRNLGDEDWSLDR